MKIDSAGAALTLGVGAILIIVFFFVGLGAYDLSAPDEPRFALVAREMLTDGHWILPHRNNQPYPDKPPLLFWLIAGCATLLNGGTVNAWTARLPSALSAAWVVGLLWHWVRRTHGTRLVANLTALTLMSCFLFFFEARMAQIDMLLCGLTTTALILGHQTLQGTRRHALAMGMCLGLGILAKGPVGYLVPAGALLVYAFFKGDGTWRRYPVSALAWGLLPALLWLGALLIMVMAGGQWDYFINLVFKQTVTRAFNPWHHMKPVYYFGTTLLYDFLPWTPLLLLALPWRKAQRRKLTDSQKLAWAALVFTLVFFSLSKGKRNIYILPAFPFAAYLAAARLAELFAKERWSGIEKILTSLLAAALALGGGGMLLLAGEIIPLKINGIPDPPPLMAIGLAGAGILACGILAARGIWRNDAAWFTGGTVTGMMLLVLAAYGAVLPWIGPYRSGRHFMEQAAAIMAAESEDPVVGMIQYRSAYRLYGNYPIVELATEFGTPRPDLPKPMEFWRDHPDGWIIATYEYWLPTKTLHKIPHRIRLRQQVGNRQPVLLVRLFSSEEKARSAH